MAATTSPGPAVSPKKPGPYPLTAGRRTALLTGVPLCLLLVAFTGFGLVQTLGNGKFPVRYTFPAQTRQVTVNAAGGNIAVRPAAHGPATLAGTANYSLVRPHITSRTTGSSTSFRYACASGLLSCGLSATVGVPAATAVSVSTGGGGATVTGISGPVTLSSGGGNLAADRTSGPLALHTDGGGIGLTAVTSSAVTASSGGGNIQAAGITSPSVIMTTDGGNIQATTVKSATVTASSGGGNIEVAFSGVPRDVRVTTSGGNITLLLPVGTTGYHVDAHTDGGTVTDSVPQNTASPNVITATSGGGNIVIGEQAP
ncbi:MAG TPA: DUF4097 family beta strand repeat-containing protein [Trebonia sp.]|nr:DUF4097 family beta strand repeat-containing protein [Trebonia sp.]